MKQKQLTLLAIFIAVVSISTAVSSVYAYQYGSNTPSSTNVQSSTNMTNATTGGNMTGAGNMSNASAPVMANST